MLNFQFLTCQNFFINVIKKKNKIKNVKYLYKKKESNYFENNIIRYNHYIIYILLGNIIIW